MLTWDCNTEWQGKCKVSFSTRCFSALLISYQSMNSECTFSLCWCASRSVISYKVPVVAMVPTDVLPAVPSLLQNSPYHSKEPVLAFFCFTWVESSEEEPWRHHPWDSRDHSFGNGCFYHRRMLGLGLPNICGTSQHFGIEPGLRGNPVPILKIA